jgi:hypothetical protein
MRPSALFFILSLLVALCRGQEKESNEKTTAENVWPKTSLWLLTLGGGESSRLIAEAADLLASQDFSCTLVTVATKEHQPAKPANALIKVSSLYISFLEFNFI